MLTHLLRTREELNCGMNCFDFRKSRGAPEAVGDFEPPQRPKKSAMMSDIKNCGCV